MCSIREKAKVEMLHTALLLHIADVITGCEVEDPELQMLLDGTELGSMYYCNWCEQIRWNMSCLEDARGVVGEEHKKMQR